MFDDIQAGWLAGDDYQRAADAREADYRKAADAAGVIELPGKYVARAVTPPPQAPQRWDVIMTGRWEDGNPPGSPA